MSAVPDLATALADAEVVHDRATIERAIARMAVRIRNDYAGSVPVYLTVMHGGLPFAGQLALEIGAQAGHATVVALDRERGDAHVEGALLHAPGTHDGQRLSLVDDVVDQQHAAAAQRRCRAVLPCEFAA